ncbi:hypothetical protein AB0B28_16395 [Glycomyces sp. NPDC046736]|uniref:hypothetical protein n=1 Tax=Glycomyces sp. NPDC046736 TaxID=3155615 RepID=UPI0033C652C1
MSDASKPSHNLGVIGPGELLQFIVFGDDPNDPDTVETWCGDSVKLLRISGLRDRRFSFGDYQAEWPDWIEPGNGFARVLLSHTIHRVQQIRQAEVRDVART